LQELDLVLRIMPRRDVFHEDSVLMTIQRKPQKVAENQSKQKQFGCHGDGLYPTAMEVATSCLPHLPSTLLSNLPVQTCCGELQLLPS
jgi:hypothetical protein